MITILINLYECQSDKSRIVLNAVRFFPERSKVRFIFLSDQKADEDFLHLQSCSYCGHQLKLEWVQEEEIFLKNFFYLKEKYKADSIIALSIFSEHADLPGYYEILTPVLKLYSLADHFNGKYELPVESILAVTVSKFCQELKKKNVQYVQFIQSQLSFLSDMEDNIITILEQNFNVNRITAFDFYHHGYDLSEYNLCIYPQEFLNYLSVSIPSAYTIQNHKFDFPVFYIDQRLSVENGVKQQVRYILQTILDICHETVTPLNSYRNFARLYDTYMNHVAYHHWADFLLQQYRTIKKENPSSVLEIACGTGSVAHLLADRISKVIATDQSPEMMDICQEKGQYVHAFQSDMTDFQVDEKTDFVICLFDSVNYLTDQKSLIKLFSHVYDQLNPGGVFIFDISTVLNSEENFDGYINLEEYPDSMVLHRADYFKSKKMQETHLNIYTRAGLNYRREDEIHQQKVWRIKEIMDTLKAGQFILSGIYDINNMNNLIRMSLEKLDSQYQRLFFVLHRNGDE